MKNEREYLLKGFSDSINVAFGLLFMGFAFGVIVVNHGFGFVMALLSPLLIFSGTAQFAMLDMIDKSTGLISVMVITFLINARHIFYGIPLLEEYEKMGKRKRYMIFALADEGFVILNSKKRKGEVDESWFYCLVFVQLYCVLGSVLGFVVGGGLNKAPEGMEFALTAAFIVSLLDYMKDKEAQLPVFVGLFSAVVSLVIFGSDTMILPALVLTLSVLLIINNNSIKMKGKKLIR